MTKIWVFCTHYYLLLESFSHQFYLMVFHWNLSDNNSPQIPSTLLNILDYYLLLKSFSHQFYLMVFHWSLSDSKSPQVSRTFLSFLSILNDVVVWMVSSCPPTSKSFSPFYNSLVTVPRALIMIGIIVTFIFHSFFNSLVLYSYWRNDKDAIRLLYKNIYLSLYCKGSKRVTQGLCVRGSWRLNTTAIFWPPNLWPATLCLSRSSDAQLEVQRPTLLGDGFLYSILSASSPDLNSSGPKGPFGLMWLSLPHLVYNSIRSSTQLQLPLGLELNSTGPWLPSWLRYIIIQHPHDHPLDLWNRMFNRHQAEITVMQFTGHSLPVHQSISVPWEFFSSSHFDSQFPPTRFPLITAIRMYHRLPVHHLGMAFLAGSKGQNITLARLRYLYFFSLSFSFILWSAGTAKSAIMQVLFFLLISCCSSNSSCSC